MVDYYFNVLWVLIHQYFIQNLRIKFQNQFGGWKVQMLASELTSCLSSLGDVVHVFLERMELISESRGLAQPLKEIGPWYCTPEINPHFRQTLGSHRLASTTVKSDVYCQVKALPSSSSCLQIFLLFSMVISLKDLSYHKTCFFPFHGVVFLFFCFF